jgi:hypothetical protein
MQPALVFDPVARALEKQLAREQDDACLVSGQISREALQQRNGLYSKLDLSRSVIVRRDVALRLAK